MNLLNFFGHLHPVLLHLPIGFLLLAFLMEWYSRRKGQANLLPAIGFGLKLGMWAAVLTAISGYLLSRDGGYEEATLFWHQWLGVGTALVSIVIFYLHKNKSKKPNFEKAYFPTFCALMVLLLAAGHLGGTLTHGDGFLLNSLEDEKEQAAITNLENEGVYENFIQPIFKEKCYSCHNESKQKGKLLLKTIEGIEKGGKTGALFVAGKAKTSLLMKRIHLPLEEKKHMPPKSKKQMTPDEIALLEWWISSGGAFDKTVGETEKTEDIQKILNKYVKQDEGVFDLEIDAASESKISNLLEAGIKVLPIAHDNPFLEINLSGRQDLEVADLKKLKAVSEQIISLNLSNSNLTDEMMSVVADLPHVQKLFLQKTTITGKGLQALQQLQYLEYLNVYDTKVDDAGLEYLKNLKRLNKLFLWQTDVKEAAMSSLENELPNLIIDRGISEDIFGDSKLKPPLVIAERDIFKDSLVIELKMNFNGVNIHYTLDGSEPDSTSLLYESPIVIKQSAELKAISMKENWATSDLISQFYVRAKYQAKTIKLDSPPSDKYKGKGGKSLGDFVKGSMAFGDGNWLGYQGEHLVATLDLGKVESVSRVTVSALEDTNSWIFYPKGLNISLSTDGKKFKSIASTIYPTTSEPLSPELKNFSETFNPTNARYVKVKVRSNLKNADWHPAPGQACWVFVDEILVE